METNTGFSILLHSPCDLLRKVKPFIRLILLSWGCIYSRYQLGDLQQTQPKFPGFTNRLTYPIVSCTVMWWCTFHQCFVPKIECFLFPPPKYVFWVRRLFSKRVAVLVTSVHKPFLKKEENFLQFNITHTPLKRVENLCSTLQFCHRVPRAVYSKLMPIPSCL